MLMKKIIPVLLYTIYIGKKIPEIKPKTKWRSKMTEGFHAFRKPGEKQKMAAI